MLPIQHAARALGVPDDQIRRLAKQGTIPGAVERGGEWLIPTMSLVGIARQQGWTLDLAALQQQLDEHALSRYSGDALAAQAAVLLAKTQATAARVESRDLLRRLREATSAAEADRAARDEAAESLADLQRQLEEARRNQAVAEARLTEVRSRLSNDDQQFRFMADRIRSLEQERQQLNRSLGWFGRLRYRRLVERDPSSAAPTTEKQAADDAVLAPTHRATAETEPVDNPRSSNEDPAVHEQVALESPTAGPPVVDLPVWDVTSQPTSEQEATSAPENWAAPAMAPLPPRVPMTFPAQRQPSDADDQAEPDERPPRRYTQVPRTPDGRFDRSALPGARAASPLPTR